MKTYKEKSKTWPLICSDGLTVEQDVDGDFFITIHGVRDNRIPMLKYKSTITAIRKMCDWMEKRL